MTGEPIPRGAIVEIYRLFDALAGSIILAGAFLGHGQPQSAIAALNEADDLADQIERKFGVILTPEEVGEERPVHAHDLRSVVCSKRGSPARLSPTQGPGSLGPLFSTKEINMGYSTCNGHLCCDVCGGYSGKSRMIEEPGPDHGSFVTIRSVTKRRCPYNWCPPPAICNLCWETKKAQWKASHGTCKPAHERFKAECEREAALIAEGRYVRASACSTSKSILSPDADLVHVIFRSKSCSPVWNLIEWPSERHIYTYPPSMLAWVRC